MGNKLITKRLKLNNGGTAKFKRLDGFCRPIYTIIFNIRDEKNKSRGRKMKVELCYVDVDKNTRLLYSMSKDGEPICPLRKEFQPIEEIE